MIFELLFVLFVSKKGRGFGCPVVLQPQCTQISRTGSSVINAFLKGIKQLKIKTP